MLIPVLFAILYLLACFGIASFAVNKKVGSQRTFHIAVLFTPLIAYLVVALSPKKEVVKLQLFKCKRCGFEYTDKHITCPACAKEGINVFVNESVKRAVSLK
jgi:hypothetical protein